MKMLKNSLMIMGLLGALSLSPVLAEGEAKINVNTASETQLATLTGIGPKKAQAIIDFREKYGNFNHVEDLDNVPGIGEKTIEKNRSNISLENPE